MTSFYNEKELLKIGFKSIGEKVLISRKSSIYSPEKISIGDNVRIDDFCILSGNITIGSNIHISAYCALYGANGIIFKDFSGVSPRCTILSATDDFSGEYLVGPIHPSELTNVTGGPVVLKEFVQLGSGTVVFPNIIIGEGAVTGAMTLVRKNIEPWTMNVGVPSRIIKKRSNSLINKRY